MTNASGGSALPVLSAETPVMGKIRPYTELLALIDKLIRPGEKVQIINEIDGLGGYNTELEAHAGN